MKAMTDRLERFLLLFLFVNPFLDLIGGLYIKLAAKYPLPGVSPSLLVRMLVLGLMGLYLLLRRDRRSILTLAGVGVCYLLTLAAELLQFYGISLKEDVQYIVRFAFNLTALLCYLYLFRARQLGRDELVKLFDRVCRVTANVLSLGILLPYLFGIGDPTYGDRFGFRGCRGFFYSGNDITAVMMIVLPMCLAGLYMLEPLEKCGWRTLVLRLLPPAWTVAALLLIGTKTAFLSLAGIMAAALAWALGALLRKKNRRLLLRLALVVLAMLLTLLVLKLFAPTDVSKTISTSAKKPAATFDDIGVANTILSGRQVKFNTALRMWKENLPWSAAVGIGRGTQYSVVEMDLFEVFFYYGVLGCAAMLWVYLTCGVRFLRAFFRKPDVWSFMAFVGLGLAVGYLAVAGHVLFSVTSGFWFALMLAVCTRYDESPVIPEK